LPVKHEIVDLYGQTMNTYSKERDMRLQHKLPLLLILLTLSIVFVPKTFAAYASVTGRIVDSSNTPVTNSQVIVKDATSQKTVTTIQTDPFGNYNLHVPPGTYNLTVIPPAGSGIPQMTKSNLHISSNTSENITLSASSKFPNSKQGKKGFGTVSTVVLYEILAMILVVAGYIFWKRKIIKLSK